MKPPFLVSSAKEVDFSRLIKNRAVVSSLTDEPHAFATFCFRADQYPESLVQEIAIGQSLGAWETSFVEENALCEKVAKVVSWQCDETRHFATLAFPASLWHGELSWLVTLLFGKISFYEGVQLSSVSFSPDCFAANSRLAGPRHSIDSLRSLVGASPGSPLLMGILKPNVAMSVEQIGYLYAEAAEAGIHLLKDDEIRHDACETEVLRRVEHVASLAQTKGLRTLYAVHAQVGHGKDPASFAQSLKNAGAQALLVNTWTAGFHFLQTLRQHTDLPLLAHPALVGAFGVRDRQSSLHPRVSLAQLVRAAGADLSLFPSPYGKLGLERAVALDIADWCSTRQGLCWKSVLPTLPTPSAGILPEHAAMARRDFGQDFVLNAGTGIFSHPQGVRFAIRQFQQGLGE